MSLLELSEVTVHYGELQAIHGFGLDLAEGETLAVVGANGAGKSTLLKGVAGAVLPSGGTIRLDGADITSLPSHRRVAAGIALVPEGRHIFPSLSVEENLKIGAHVRRPGPWSLQRVYDAFPLVGDRRTRLGTHLSGGEQQAVAIARALMSNPRVLLIDELSLGLAPVVVAEIYRSVPAIVAAGTAVLLVEQDVNQALGVADRVLCLLEGRAVLEGTPETLTHEQIVAAYFGLDPAAHGPERPTRTT